MNIKNKVSAKLLATSVLSSLLFFSNCKKENENNLSFDDQTAASTDSLNKLAIARSAVPSNAYRLEKALPSGYVKNGTKDYTSYIQAALKKYSVVVFPNFPILINDTGLKIPSNREIYFVNGAELRLKPTSKASYAMLQIYGVSNVKLIDPVVVGDRQKHLGKGGEHGMGISIKGSKDITISGGKISQCWGDGIYIGNYQKKLSQDIKISDVEVKYSRRDGISVTSVDGLLLENSYFGFSSGTPPEAGMNFEAEGHDSEMKNIVVRNVTTEKNSLYGMQIGLSDMYGNGRNESISITIDKLIDKGSKNAFKTSVYVANRVKGEKISGSIKVNSPSWSNNWGYVYKKSIQEDNIAFSILSPRIAK